ncbi:hypothetical protein FB107DRAFT_170686, partial [Schizophyllum commune]
MRTADRAYYGVYTPSCPIQPDSLRNRVHGAATWISRSDKHGLISYESGLGKRKTNNMEFARYLEGLAKEMQPVLDTLVRATVADDELTPKAWQFELEMQKHARSLREARSHSDLSFAHVAASQQCAKAVHFYRKYRKRAEDLLRITPQPEPAQQTTNPPTSAAPSAGHCTSRIAHEHPPFVASPSIRASASSKPLLGMPAGGKEVGLGPPAHTPPHKDEPSLAGKMSGSTNTTMGLATVQRCPSQRTRQFGKTDGATRRESHVQVMPSETASPNRKIPRDGRTADPREHDRSSRVCHSTQPHTRQESQGEGGSPSPLSPVRPRFLWRPDSPPHLAHLSNPVDSSPSMATAASAPLKARPCPVPPENSNELVIKECDISAREGSRARRAPWVDMLWTARSQRQHLSSCSPARALGSTIPARDSSREAVVPSAKVEGRPVSAQLRSSRTGCVNTSRRERAHHNTPSPPRLPSPRSSFPSSREMRPVRAWTSWIETRPTTLEEQASTELDISAREECDAQHAPWDDLPRVGISGARVQRCL